MTQRSGLERPGGRTARTTQAVHDAVRALLRERDSRDVQVSEIAARAGVNATTVYRRWGSADALILEVAVEDLDAASPVPATGDLRQDLRAYAHQVHDGVRAPGGLGFLHALITAAADPAVGAEGATGIVQTRLAGFQHLLDRAAPRSTLTPIDLVDGLLAPIYFRALLSQPSTLTDEDLDRLVDNLHAVDQHRRGTTRG